MTDGNFEYLFEDNKPVWVDFISMVPADILAAHDADVAVKARREALEEAAKVVRQYERPELRITRQNREEGVVYGTADGPIAAALIALIDAPTAPEGERGD